MADEPNKDQPVEGIEGELGDLIAEAESLTEGLVAEIGRDGTDPTPREAEFFGSETDSEASVDLQIAQADTALEEATKELGKVPETPKPEKKVTLPPKGKKEAAPPDSSEVPAAAPASKTVTLPPASPAQDAKGSPPKSAKQLVAAKVDETPFDLEAPRTGRLAVLSSRLPLEKLSRLSRTSASATCTALEVIDRPFHRVSYKVRSLMGWLALFFAVAAASIYLFVIR